MTQSLWSIVLGNVFASDPAGLASLAAVSKTLRLAASSERLWENLLRQRWLSEFDDLVAELPASEEQEQEQDGEASCLAFCRGAEEAVRSLLANAEAGSGREGSQAAVVSADGALLDPPARRHERFRQVFSRISRQFSARRVGQLLHCHGVRSDQGVKERIGELLGRLAVQADAPEVLHGFMAQVGVEGQTLLDSLRLLMQALRLPGEASHIDRIMEAFAEHYSRFGGSDPEEQAMDVDCVFVLSFSCIMLQTDLHNPQVRKKMTEDEFIRPNRGINSGGNLSDALLSRIYRGVAERPVCEPRQRPSRQEPPQQQHQQGQGQGQGCAVQ